MKPLIRIGQTFMFKTTVTEAMRAHFEEITVHHLYSTAAMLTHMEWASRQHILPALEPGEEGAGYQMVIDHLSPVPIGEEVSITSTVTGLTPNRVTCACTAMYQGRVAGHGTIVQAIVPLHRLKQETPL
jgi:predicted thioesterase